MNYYLEESLDFLLGPQDLTHDSIQDQYIRFHRYIKAFLVKIFIELPNRQGLRISIMDQVLDSQTLSHL